MLAGSNLSVISASKRDGVPSYFPRDGGEAVPFPSPCSSVSGSAQTAHRIYRGIARPVLVKLREGRARHKTGLAWCRQTGLPLECATSTRRDTKGPTRQILMASCPVPLNVAKPRLQRLGKTASSEVPARERGTMSHTLSNGGGVCGHDEQATQGGPRQPYGDNDWGRVMAEIARRRRAVLFRNCCCECWARPAIQVTLGLSACLILFCLGSS